MHEYNILQLYTVNCVTLFYILDILKTFQYVKNYSIWV